MNPQADFSGIVHPKTFDQVFLERLGLPTGGTVCRAGNEDAVADSKDDRRAVVKPVAAYPDGYLPVELVSKTYRLRFFCSSSPSSPRSGTQCAYCNCLGVI